MARPVGAGVGTKKGVDKGSADIKKTVREIVTAYLKGVEPAEHFVRLVEIYPEKEVEIFKELLPYCYPKVTMAQKHEIELPKETKEDVNTALDIIRKMYLDGPHAPPRKIAQ